MSRGTHYKICRDVETNGVIISIEGGKSEKWLVVGDKKTRLAFKYENNKIIPCSESEAVYHCYLPTLDKVTFPLKINSDFSTDPSRKHITMDDISANSIKMSAKTIFNLICKVINDDIKEPYENLLTILSQKSSFSRMNIMLCDFLKQYIVSTAWLKIKNGSIINPTEYKVLPDWLEESEKIFLRENSKCIEEQSLSGHTQKQILNLEEFLKQYSQAKYSTENFIEVLEDSVLADKLSSQTQGKILGNIIKAGKSEQYISGKDYNLDSILISINGKAHPISELAKNTNIKLDSSLVFGTIETKRSGT